MQNRARRLWIEMSSGSPGIGDDVDFRKLGAVSLRHGDARRGLRGLVHLMATLGSSSRPAFLEGSERLVALYSNPL
jgi:hypothetical protein